MKRILQEMAKPRFLESTRFIFVASLGFQLAALAAAVAIGTWGIHHMSRVEDEEFYQGFSMIEAAFRLKSLAQQEIIMTRGRLLAPDSQSRKFDSRVFDDYDDTLSEVARHGVPADAALITSITLLGREYRTYAKDVYQLIDAGRREEALALHLADGVALKNRWLPQLDQLIARRRGQVNANHDEVNALENLIKLSLAIASIVTLPLALLLSLVLGRRVVGPLRALEAASNAMGAGKLDARVPVAREDEFGHVAQAFNQMADRVGEAVDRLKAANEDLVRLDRTKDEFLSIVSHELRTPLNAMRGFGTLMESGMAGPMSDQQRQYAANIVQSANRMERLVNDLLDLASLRLEKLRLEREPTDYHLLVEDVAAQMAPIAHEKALTLETRVAEETTPVIDYDRVAQVLTNLVGNAVKFTPRGGTITIDVARRNGCLRTEVRDTGGGIAPEEMPKLFQPFSQLDMGSARKVGGSGLGLSISKALIEAHGGAIGVESQPGRGATFWYELPLG